MDEKPDKQAELLVKEQARKKKITTIIALLAILILVIAALIYYFFRRTLTLPGVTARPHYVSATYGDPNKLLREPWGVAVDQDTGRVYICDSGNSQVQVVNAGGAYQFSFSKLDGKNNLQGPIFAAVNSKGEVYVSDRITAEVYIFNSEGKFLKKFVPNNDPNFVWNPLGLTFGKQDRLYAVDSGVQNRVLVFDSKGKLIRQFGKKGQTWKTGELKGQLFYPQKVALDSKGRIFVTDGNNKRVQVFTSTGKFLAVMATGPTLRGIAIDNENRIYIPDIFGHIISVYEYNANLKKGKRQVDFGEQGKDNAQFSFPSDVTIGSGGRIYVVDRGNNRVQIWSY